MAWSKAVSRRASALRDPLLCLMLAAFACGGCARLQKRQTVTLDTSPLIEADRLQGWDVAEKIPPIVGEFDVTYLDEEEAEPRPGNGPKCLSAEQSDGSTMIICPPKSRRSRTPPDKIRYL